MSKMIGKRYYAGQALTELLVALAVIVPLFLLIPTLANYLDVQTTTHEASRYVAWERTVYSAAEKSPDQVRQEVQELFVESEETGFSTGNKNAVRERWADFGGDNVAARRSIIDNDKSVAVTDVQVIDGVAIQDIATSVRAMNGLRNSSAFDANSLGRNDVSLPLRSNASLLRDSDTPDDLIAGEQRFHTKSAVAILSNGGGVPRNAQAFKATMDNDVVRHDGRRLGLVQAPGYAAGLLLGAREVTSIMGGPLASRSTASENLSTQLPYGLIQYNGD